MSEQRWTEETERLVADALAGSPWITETSHERAVEVLTTLADAGLLVTPSTPDGPRTWGIDPEPGPEVTAVRCDCCGIKWEREVRKHPFFDRWNPNGAALGARLWRPLILDHVQLGSRLTDASGEVHGGQ